MLYLIGSAHCQIGQSKRKLKQIYNRVKPDVILSETSEGEAQVFELQAPALTLTLSQTYPDVRKIPEIIELLRERYLGFEYCFNRTYAQTNRITHFCFDRFDETHAIRISQNLEDQIRMLMSGQLELVEESLRAKKRPDIPVKKIRKDWEKYEKNEGTPEQDKRLQGNDEFKRDIVMEEHLRRLYQPDKTLVAIVGAVHTLESPSGITLYSRIKDLDPRRILLFQPLAGQLE
jgi:hypothetical protein